MGISGVVIRLIKVINLLFSESPRPSEYAVGRIATVACQIPVAGDSIIQGFPVEIRGTSTNSYYRSSTSHVMNTYNALGLTASKMRAPERRHQERDTDVADECDRSSIRATRSVSCRVS